MLIASKYEEIWAPEVRDFVYISDRAYTREQILGMEKLMLNTLKFNLTVPTPYNFLSRYLKATGAAEETDKPADEEVRFQDSSSLQIHCSRHTEWLREPLLKPVKESLGNKLSEDASSAAVAHRFQSFACSLLVLG